MNYEIFIPLMYQKHTIDLSYYIVTTNDMFSLGYNKGQIYEAQIVANYGVVILDFGCPEYNNGNYGTLLYDYETVLDIEQIKTAVEDYSRGVWLGLGSDYESFLTIIVGTNSSYYYVTQEHGEAWGTMINELNDWLVNQHMNSQIAIVGGSDMETNFGPPSEARAWVDGYASTGLYYFYDYGNAAGCPLDYPYSEPEYQYNITPLVCGELGWDQDDVYYVSHGRFLILPFPEIYNIHEANAQQWYRIALYSYFNYGRIMPFYGTFTQYGACDYKHWPPECDDTYNSASEAHNQLLWWLSSDHYGRTSFPLTWQSDITYYDGIP